MQNYSGRVGALDLGFYNKKYTSNKSIKDDIYNEKFEILFLLSADEIDFEKIPDKTFVVYFGHHGDRAVKRADLVIPISCFTEKEGIYVNLEGRPQISRQVKLPLPSVDDFSVVLKKISKFVNINLGYSNPQELKRADA